MSISEYQSPTCSICGELVDLETCKTDDHGHAVHGQCYSAQMAFATALQKPGNSINPTFQIAKPVPPADGDGSTDELTHSDWQKPYREALVETDDSRLKQKILDAEAAMFKRQEELGRSPHSDGSDQTMAAIRSERLAISNALSILNALRNEIGKTRST